MRHGGAVVVRGPAEECEDATGGKRDDTTLMVDHVLLGDPAEAEPVLEALLDPHQFDMGEFAHAVPSG